MSGAAGLFGAVSFRNSANDTAGTADFWRVIRAWLDDIQRMCRGKPLQPILGCAPQCRPRLRVFLRMVGRGSYEAQSTMVLVGRLAV